MNLPRAARALLFGVAIITASGGAGAQAGGDVDAAKRLFEAGAQAYASGQFTVAVQAFEQAQRQVPKPAILFSLAQAQRRQYFIDKNPQMLRSAVQNFRTYLQQVPAGGRRVDAAQALAELEPLDARLSDAQAATRPAVKEPARLMIMSRAPGASASIDAQDSKPVPLGVEVTPGKHKVRVTAPGFFPEEREPVAIENTIVPVDVSLRPEPARLVVDGPRGAEVSVDGKVVGEVGRSEYFEVPAGTRFVTVTKNGRQPFSQEIEVVRGQRKVLEAALGVTRQRVVSYGFLGVAAVSALVGTAFTLSAFDHQNKARKLDERRIESNITVAERDEYDAEVRGRDNAVDGALISLAVTGVTGAIGGILWVFDQPSAPSAPTQRQEGAPRPQLIEPTEISIGPGPGLGAAFRGRF